MLISKLTGPAESEAGNLQDIHAYLKAFPKSKLSATNGEPHAWSLTIESSKDAKAAFDKIFDGYIGPDAVDAKDGGLTILHGEEVPLAPQQECRLLSLAPEIRNRIYRYVLVEDEDSDIIIDSDHALPAHPSLLHTCRQIRHEASEIYFAENVFVVRIHTYDARAFIK